MSKKIAIIGSGVAGLSAAWLLGERHEISLFEKNPSLGMGHKGLYVDTPQGKTRIDIPPRVINTDHYVELFKLLGDANLETVTFKQQASFSDLEGETYLSFKTWNTGVGSWTLPKLTPSNFRWLQRHGTELLKWLKFIRQPAPTQGNESLTDYVTRAGFSESFMNSLLIPMWALMCTCQKQQLEQFPTQHLLELFQRFTNLTPSRRIRGGTERFETRLKERIANLHLKANVKSIAPRDAGIEVTTTDGVHNFDQIIVATEPHDAQRLLNENWQEERNLISQVPYFETEMVMHQDISFLPRSKSNWAPVNLFVNQDSSRISATLWMNRLEEHNPGDLPILQSWDPDRPVSSVLSRRTFKRSLSTPDSEKAIAQLRDLQLHSRESRRIWFVGSYMTPGVPLLENGVASAKNVTSWINC